MATAQRSPLFRMPPEIRNIIYSLVVARAHKIIVRGPDCATPAFAQTSHQMREEVVPIWLENNIFTMTTANSLHKWLPVNPVTHSLINSIAFDLESSVMWYHTLKHFNIQPTRIIIPDNEADAREVTVIWASHARVVESLATRPRRGAIKAYSELTELLDERVGMERARLGLKA
ncbi:uncharacterized protein RCC_07784 [Ramularia collo-cygni]|uniref:Uncharacterized protein n=1 Tax=Ramularia collo-cygni TaxID=112498 RepID=A0A2D3VAU3_9PEZI|nr:uncharacterized protein RCC_07784 [Ramularia collo-cygni]CZT21917.1 uncharacterized protein RCC_07784 [Ramularia collo-cygni]